MQSPGEVEPRNFGDIAVILPTDFRLKRDLLRCDETDRILHTTSHDPQLELDTLRDTLPLVDEWMKAGDWRDSYELMRYAEEKGLTIDRQLHEQLGSAIISRGIVGFAEVEAWRREGAPRLAELGDFVHFMTAHNARYPDRPEKLEQAVQLSEAFFNGLVNNPNAEYELLDLMHDVDWSVGRKERYIIQLLEFHAEPERIKRQLAEAFEIKVSDSPSRALEKIRLGYRINLYTTDELYEFFERSLDAIDIERRVISRAGPIEPNYPEGENPDYYWCEKPSEVVEPILRDAQKREAEVIGRRTSEYVDQNLEQLQGTAGEFDVLQGTVNTMHALGQEVPAEVVDRLVALSTFRGETKFNPRLDKAMTVLITLSKTKQIDTDQLLIAFDQITELYLDTASRPDFPSVEATSDDWGRYFAAADHWQVITSGGVTDFIADLAHVLHETSPEVDSRKLSDFVSLPDLFEMIDRYEKHELEPLHHLMTDERKRLVTTYRREDFREPDRYGRESRSGLPVFMPRVQHPEKGPRNMIALHPLEATAKQEALQRLRTVVLTDDVARFVDWHHSLWRGEEVAFLKAF